MFFEKNYRGRQLQLGFDKFEGVLQKLKFLYQTICDTLRIRESEVGWPRLTNLFSFPIFIQATAVYTNC